MLPLAVQAHISAGMSSSSHILRGKSIAILDQFGKTFVKRFADDPFLAIGRAE